MIPRIKSVNALDNYMLRVSFDDNKTVLYNVADDIRQIEDFKSLETVEGLWQNVQLDSSRTCIFWNDRIDLASDSIYEFGIKQ